MTNALAKRRGGRGLYRKPDPAQRSPGKKRRTLPEYLLPGEIDGLLRAAEHGGARMLMLLQWRAGLRVSEAINVDVSDVALTASAPTLKVRMSKGGKDRVVPLHPELATAIRNAMDYGGLRAGRLVPVSRSTAWRWVQTAQVRAEQLGAFPPGKHIGTHTLRHSAARHWLASGVPINAVSRWLGHAHLATTLIYLQILPDPTGYMDRVP